jgi:hypothetical protein
LALVRPVTRNAKPTCMNSTRNPVRRVHVKLMDTPRWAVSVASWLIPSCDTGTFPVVAG